MAHELDYTTGRAAMAYVGETPWHGLGASLKRGASMAEWQRAAGLDWRCNRDVVQFARNNNPANEEGELGQADDRHVLWRSDTGGVLSIVSRDYRIVQPDEVMEFFKKLTGRAGFEMETAGALFDGRRIWGLARAGEDARIKDDIVRPYVLLATSYDGQMATVAQFTSIRVVCNNTLNASLQSKGKQNRVLIPHSATFCSDAAIERIGIRLDGAAWDRFIGRINKLAARPANQDDLDKVLQEIMMKPKPEEDEELTLAKFRQSKAYGRIMGLFEGEQKGGDMDAVRGTAWGALSAITQYFDWEAGRIQSNRLDSAWLGQAARTKLRALEVLEGMAA